MRRAANAYPAAAPNPLTTIRMNSVPGGREAAPEARMRVDGASTGDQRDRGDDHEQPPADELRGRRAGVVARCGDDDEHSE